MYNGFAFFILCFMTTALLGAESESFSYSSTSSEQDDSAIVASMSKPESFTGEEIETIFGVDTNPSQLVLELLASPIMQRLKGIDQSGITKYMRDLPSFSRYDHSLGVYMLLKKYGRSEQECIAGLLHDASHTVFSHVGDLVFEPIEDKDSYQDKIHTWYLYAQGVDKILQKYGLAVDDILPKNSEFVALEQELPSLCADRIEYNLHTAYLFGLLSQDEVDQILESLHFDGKIWYFDDFAQARRFADLSLYFTTNLWAGFDNLMIYRWAAEALRHSLAQHIISWHEMHFSTDSFVLGQLNQSNDAIVDKLLKKCRFLSSYAWVAEPGDDVHVQLKGKFRGVDPFVFVQTLSEAGYVRLSDMDQDFNVYYQETKRKTEEGFNVRILEDLDLFESDEEILLEQSPSL